VKLLRVDVYSNDYGCRPAVRCADCNTYGQLVLRAGRFVCRSEVRCEQIRIYGEER
jgi:hypothetical protein